MGNAGVLDPQGPVALAERTMLFNATAIMLAVILPVIALTLVTAWWFRAGNARARYLPDWDYSGRIELVVWAIPTLVIMFLGGIAWIGSHQVDPYAPLVSEGQPLDVEVVSLDWKWLFIYPEQSVASVGRLTVPAGRPIRFRLTSASVMNSFLVPQLGSQIYTMAGMVTRLSLLADKPGRYPGLSAQFSGSGFSDMRFEVEAVPGPEFDDWVARTRAGPDALDQAAYAALAQPGTSNAQRAFASVPPGLFDAIVGGDGVMPASAAPTSSHAQAH
ncbi:ubiquinol oxidase subunit II [Mesorhizobium sp.]|jgi:cytochrome o ubiquinol oxidase subunit 2|uniref:ubiquinol oxidase subunit II n=1 Tax=Mesorhizobium sp. TaxID=1871066 RepID=UPI003568197A